MNWGQVLLKEPGPNRTAAMACWFQGLFERDPPVLVGGAAVELYTLGAYRTTDLDFVGRVPPVVSRALEKEGFARRGRHWVHEEAQVFIELPSASFDRPVQIDSLEIDGWTIVLLSPEDVLVDRLAAWKFWRVPVDGINAYLLFRAHGGKMDEKHLMDAARAEDVADALGSLREFAGRDREPEEIEQWAQSVQ